MDHVTQEKAELAMSHLNSKLRKGLNDISAFSLFTMIYGEGILEKIGVRLIAPNDVVLKPELMK